jgi:hypothetical protein
MRDQTALAGPAPSLWPHAPIGVIRAGWIGMQMPDADDALFVGFIQYPTLFFQWMYFECITWQFVMEFCPSEFHWDVCLYGSS